MKKAILIVLFLISFTAIGAYFKLSIVPYVVFSAVCIVTILITTDKIKSHEYPIYIFGMSLALLWQTSMIGTYIVGADIHGELFIANRVIGQGWDWSYSNVNNVSVVLGGISPVLAKIGISPVWQFKLFYPAIFASVPLILYFAYRKMIGEKRAYFASLFFVIVPMFFVEVVGIIKSMIAEVFFALMILFMAINIKSWQKAVGIGLSALIATMCHYTIGTLAILYLTGSFIVLLINKPVNFKWLQNRHTSLLHFSIVLLCIMTMGIAWLSTAGSGTIWNTYKDIISNLVGVTSVITNSDSSTINESSTTYIEPSFISYKEPIVRAATGLDFNEVSVSGKLFRITQYATQALIVLGFVYLVFRYKRYNFTREFASCVMISYGLLAMCLFFPTFSSIINASRFYQISLFFLAPMLVIGLEQVTRDTGMLYKKVRASNEYNQ